MPTIDDIIGVSALSSIPGDVNMILSISWMTVSNSMNERKKKHLPSIASSIESKPNEPPQYKDKIESTTVIHFHSFIHSFKTLL